MNFSTLNESSLHNTLKKLYAFENDGQMEVEKDGHIYDILCHENYVIEIQNQNLAKLLPKILDSINKGYKIKVVHPVVITKRIELHDQNNNLISRRKSPKKGSIYNIFKELTGIYPVLLDSNFELEVPEIEITEIREKTEENVQAKNNRRRFKKNWNKTGKKLNQILRKNLFSNKSDYLNLLPPGLSEEFCAKDIKEHFVKKSIPNAANNAHLLLWVFSKMELIEFTDIKNRSKYYRIK